MPTVVVSKHGGGNDISSTALSVPSDTGPTNPDNMTCPFKHYTSLYILNRLIGHYRAPKSESCKKTYKIQSLMGLTSSKR